MVHGFFTSSTTSWKSKRQMNNLEHKCVQFAVYKHTEKPGYSFTTLWHLQDSTGNSAGYLQILVLIMIIHAQPSPAFLSCLHYFNFFSEKYYPSTESLFVIGYFCFLMSPFIVSSKTSENLMIRCLERLIFTG